jgi:hypothetical protein
VIHPISSWFTASPWPTLSSIADHVLGEFQEYVEAGVQDYLRTAVPITVFVPSYDESIPLEMRKSSVKNHIFKGLWFRDELLQMDGQYIYSAINNNSWVVSVLGENIFLEAAEESEGAKLVVQLQEPYDVLARNGVIQYIDSPLLSSARPPATALIVQVNATFLIFYTEEVTSDSSSESGLILATALEHFVENLKQSLENKPQESRHLRSIADDERRRLEVTLQPGSVKVYSIQDVDCRDAPAAMAIPDEAKCHNVKGGYNLVVEDEDEEVVFATYVKATNNAIQDGKLQESINAVAPESPIIVAGPISAEADTDLAFLNEEDEMMMPWWLILLICLAAFSNCCCLGLASAYFATRKRASRGDSVEESTKFLKDGQHKSHSENHRPRQSKKSTRTNPVRIEAAWQFPANL